MRSPQGWRLLSALPRLAPWIEAQGPVGSSAGVRAPHSRALPRQCWNVLAALAMRGTGGAGGSAGLVVLIPRTGPPLRTLIKVSGRPPVTAKSCCPGCPPASLVGVEWQAVTWGGPPVPPRGDSVLAQGARRPWA